MYSQYHRAHVVHELAVCGNVDDFVSAPIGSCVVGATHLVWCATPELQGAIIWGTLDEGALRELLDIERFNLHPVIAGRRRRVLLDCRGVTHVDADALVWFATEGRERVARWAAEIEREAVIVPAGVAGILLSGALPAAGASYPLRISHDLDDALGFVDHRTAHSAQATATRIADVHRGGSLLLARLRAHLGRDLSAPTVEAAAETLGMSTRTLQRELARLDTSFSEELRLVRVATAESLLIHSDLKIDAIAHKVGLGNASRMSATLRRERNITASELRARSRG